MRTPQHAKCENSNETLPLTSAASAGEGKARDRNPSHSPLYLAEECKQPSLGTPPDTEEKGAEPRKGTAGGRMRYRFPRDPRRSATLHGAGRSEGLAKGAARSPGARCHRPGALRPLSLLLLHSRPQRPHAAGMAAAAGARVPPPSTPSRRLLRRRQQLQAAPQYSPPYHLWGEPSPGLRPSRRPPAARPGAQRSAEFAPGCPITYSL
ncbi:hypothetical protein PAL_GLEAN10013478 [Pteropus alecto]|uniref:Uncharacterized protein n=1 Tax=Pteropus alecto TaxID=9402 RepID=L5JSZ5_PTEAL|nr:hypothetical protein PAL_GLEAN10013478 [Pteropus alecto]